MATMIENRDLRFCVFERLSVRLRRAHRHQRVLAPPDDLRRQAAHALQKMRQALTMKNRLPGDARGLSARVLEGLELLRGALAAVELGELGRTLRIVDAQVERRALRDHEDVEDLALRRLYPQRRDQYHLAKLPRVGDRHLGRNPSAEREADYV